MIAGSNQVSRRGSSGAETSSLLATLSVGSSFASAFFRRRRKIWLMRVFRTLETGNGIEVQVGLSIDLPHVTCRMPRHGSFQ